MVLVTEDGLAAETGLTIKKFHCGMGTSFPLHLLISVKESQKKVIWILLFSYKCFVLSAIKVRDSNAAIHEKWDCGYRFR